ncbi:MAG: hypothetical protein GY765_21305 [bacterium]|nr:hypothetical protein [bacterium]
MFQQNQNQQYDPFTAIGNATAIQKTPWIQPGIYPLLYVTELKMIQNRKGVPMFIAEVDIIQSEVADRPQGSKMSWVVNLQNDAGPGDVKGFLAALWDLPQEEITAESAQAALAENQPCAGRLIRLEASSVEMKTFDENGKPRLFTRCGWRPVAEELQGNARGWHDQIFSAASPTVAPAHQETVAETQSVQTQDAGQAPAPKKKMPWEN